MKILFFWFVNFKLKIVKLFECNLILFWKSCKLCCGSVYSKHFVGKIWLMLFDYLYSWKRNIYEFFERVCFLMTSLSSWVFPLHVPQKVVTTQKVRRCIKACKNFFVKNFIKQRVLVSRIMDIIEEWPLNYTFKIKAEHSVQSD